MDREGNAIKRLFLQRRDHRTHATLPPQPVSLRVPSEKPGGDEGHPSPIQPDGDGEYSRSVNPPTSDPLVRPEETPQEGVDQARSDPSQVATPAPGPAPTHASTATPIAKTTSTFTFIPTSVPSSTLTRTPLPPHPQAAGIDAPPPRANPPQASAIVPKGTPTRKLPASFLAPPPSQSHGALRLRGDGDQGRPSPHQQHKHQQHQQGSRVVPQKLIPGRDRDTRDRSPSIRESVVRVTKRPGAEGWIMRPPGGRAESSSHCAPACSGAHRRGEAGAYALPTPTPTDTATAIATSAATPTTDDGHDDKAQRGRKGIPEQVSSTRSPMATAPDGTARGKRPAGVVDIRNPPDWAVRANANPDLVAKVESRTLTKEDLMEALEVEMTEILRGAYHNEYLAAMVKEHLGLRPLPILSHLPRKPVTGGVGANGAKRMAIPIRLYGHQVTMVGFMAKREALDPRSVYGLHGGIINMEMGLGKTLGAIARSLIAPRPPRPERHGDHGFPTLVVASRTLFSEWKSQGFEKFFGDRVRVIYLHPDVMGKDFPLVSRRDVAECDFVVTTYDVCCAVSRKQGYYKEVLELGAPGTFMHGKVVAVRNRTRGQADRPDVRGPGIVYCTPWERVICDESQRFANHKTQTFRHVMAIYGRHKWCLSGTPIRNKATDLWAQLRFCGYAGITKAMDWKPELMEQHHLADATLVMSEEDSDVRLPPKHIHETFVTLGAEERDCYDAVEGVARKAFSDMVMGKCNFACVLAMFTRLRQCAIAPYLLTPDARHVPLDRRNGGGRRSKHGKGRKSGKGGEGAGGAGRKRRGKRGDPGGRKGRPSSRRGKGIGSEDGDAGSESDGEKGSGGRIGTRRGHKGEGVLSRSPKGTGENARPARGEKTGREGERKDRGTGGGDGDEAEREYTGCEKSDADPAKPQRKLAGGPRCDSDSDSDSGNDNDNDSDSDYDSGGDDEDGGDEGDTGEESDRDEEDEDDDVEEEEEEEKEEEEDDDKGGSSDDGEKGLERKGTGEDDTVRGIMMGITEGDPKVLAWLRNKSGTAGTRSSKVSEILRILRGIPAGEKVIIFSTFASTLDLMASACRQHLPGIGFVQVDGTIKGKRREAVLGKFKANPSVRILLMTYKVGSEGLNLTVATHIICVEPWWTNAVHDQAEARAWRTGQTEDVHVYRVYVRESIEERILEICSRKTEISQMMLGGASKKVTGLDRETLGRILGLRR